MDTMQDFYNHLFTGLQSQESLLHQLGNLAQVSLERFKAVALQMPWDVWW